VDIGRTTQFIDDAKAALKGKQTEEAVISLPPGFIAGFRLRTEDNQMFVGKGVMNCRGKAVYHKVEDIINGEDYIQSTNIIKGLTYYVYMNASQEMKIDSIASEWDDDNFGYYHPRLFQYRFLGQFDYTTSGTYENLINQDPVIGTDINANEVSSLLVKTLMAQVSDFIVVGQDPAATPTEADWACFIYEDRMEIKQYTSGSWVIKTKFGSTSVIETELYIGFTSFSGSTTLDSPGEGDRVHYISGTTDEYREYTNGGWTTVNSIKIGALVSTLFLNMVGCGGMFHPNNTPSTIECLPNPYFRVFDFEGDYEDQFGVDDWTTKNNQALSSSIKKFGTYSFTSTSTNISQLESTDGFDIEENQAVGAWVYFSEKDSADNVQIFYYYTPDDDVLVYVDTADKFHLQIHKNNILEVDTGYGGAISTGVWYYIGYSYNADTDIAYLIINNTIYSTGAIGGSWAGGAVSFNVYGYDNYSGSTSFVDELLIFYNKYLVPEYFSQHYTHGVTWSTDRSKADLLLQPDTDGRVIANSDTNVNGDLTIQSGNYSSALAVSTTEAVAHGLSSQPWIITSLLCISTELNYAAGDEIFGQFGYYDTSPAWRVFQATADATNVTFRTQSQLVVANKSTGALTAITMNKWKIRARCFM